MNVRSKIEESRVKFITKLGYNPDCLYIDGASKQLLKSQVDYLYQFFVNANTEQEYFCGLRIVDVVSNEPYICVGIYDNRNWNQR